MEVGLSFAKNSMLEKQESKSNNPEQERQKVSLNEIIVGLKEKIKNSIGFLFETKEDKEIKKFEEQLQESKEISKAADEFFRFLILRSLKKPDKEYQHEEKQKNYLELESNFLESIKGLKETMAKKPLREKQQALIAKKENNDEFIGDVVVEEKKTQDDSGEIFMQSRVCNFKQESGPNIIREGVNNYASLNKEVSYAITPILIVKNSNTGTKLDLQQLLPNEIELCPSDLFKYKEDEEEKKQIIYVDLKSYNGSKDSQGDFYTIPKRVFYGDLTKKGGLLSLMHEIAHAWQIVYYGDAFAGKDFENFHHDIALDLSVLANLKQEADEGKLNKNKFDIMIKPDLLKKLKNNGVEIDIDNFLDSAKELKEGEIKIKSILEESFIIKSDRLNQLLKNYEREERDGWAHAIRVIKFLRKKGIDLEPQLKTLDDFKSIINLSLESYQKNTEKMILSGRGVRFLKQKNKEGKNETLPQPPPRERAMSETPSLLNLP